MSEGKSLVPMTANDLAAREATERAMAQCAEAQRLIPNATPEELVEIRGWARGVNAVAQAKAARELAVQACLAQVLAERRLGLILDEKGTPEQIRNHIVSTTTQNDLRAIKRLATIPERLFADIIRAAEESSLA